VALPVTDPQSPARESGAVALPAQPAVAEAEAQAPPRPRPRPRLGRLAALAARLPLLVPAALTAFLGMQSGGFFPEATGIAAIALAALLLLRVTLARAPFAGWSRSAGLATAALGLLAVWTLLSALWSDSPARAMIEFDRTLLYTLALVLLATFAWRPGDLGIALRWLLLAMVGLAALGLVSRLYPDLGIGTVTDGRSRLAYPLTYWNALGVLCALGGVLAVHVASGGAERALARVLAVGTLPVLAVTAYLTFSRGAIVTAAIGLLAYVVLARPRRLLFTLLAAGAPTVLALRAAWDAEVLATARFALGEGPAQGAAVGRWVLGAVLGAMLLRVALLWLERRLDRVRLPRALPVALAVLALAGVTVAALAADLPDRVRTQAQEFAQGDEVTSAGDNRDRLSEVGNNGRLSLWGVALDVAEERPVLGAGAGMFAVEWLVRRPDRWQSLDGHSLYLEVLAELGVVGLAALLLALGALVGGVALRIRGPHRQAAAALLAAAIALLAHAAIDWDWEVTALFAWLFAAGGIALARAPGEAPVAFVAPGRSARVLIGLGCAVLALTPVAVVLSQRAVKDSAEAFVRGDCTRAVDGALNALDALSVRPEPHEIIGYCDLRGGQAALGVRAMRAAQARDPRDWRYHYGLAIAQAIAGEDPRPAAERARRLNPLEPLAVELDEALSETRSPRRWYRIAARSEIPRL